MCTHTAPALCVCGCPESHGEVAQEGWWISTLTSQERNRSSERLIILPKASQQVCPQHIGALDLRYKVYAGGRGTPRDLVTPCFSFIYYLPPQCVYPFCVSQK